MSAQRRLDGLLGLPALRRLQGVQRDVMAAALADCEAKIAAALALYIEGDQAAMQAILGQPTDLASSMATVPVIASFAAALEAINAAVGDDPTRGYAALASIHERAAEYSAAREQLITRNAEGNTD